MLVKILAIIKILNYNIMAIWELCNRKRGNSKKINFIFICQKCFKCYNLFRFYINLFFIFFGVSSLSIAKLPNVNCRIVEVSLIISASSGHRRMKLQHLTWLDEAVLTSCVASFYDHWMKIY